MGTRLSSQPLPLSPFAVTLNNTLSLITATITLRNKLVFFERGMEMGKKWPFVCITYATLIIVTTTLRGNDWLQISLVFGFICDSCYLFSLCLFGFSYWLLVLIKIIWAQLIGGLSWMMILGMEKKNIQRVSGKKKWNPTNDMRL